MIDISPKEPSDKKYSFQKKILLGIEKPDPVIVYYKKICPIVHRTRIGLSQILCIPGIPVPKRG